VNAGAANRRAAGVLLALGWAFWLPLWVPALLVVTFVAWVILHRRLEAGLGETLHRLWPPGPLVLIALLSASTLAFVLHDAPATMKIVPVGLDVFALSLIFFGAWWTRVTLPRWLGGPGSSPPFPVRTSGAIGSGPPGP